MTKKEKRWSSVDTTRLGLFVAVAAVVRFGYLAFLGVPPYDPWRHLQLVDNLRAGAGFTLFDGQPYLWYQPLWYRLLALLPESLAPEFVAALFSAVAVGFLFLWLRAAEDRATATVAAILFMLCGPLVRFTCHYGPEAFAMCLVLAALWYAAAREDRFSPLVAGLLYGVGLTARMNFLFVAPLFLPGLRTPARFGTFSLGAAIPLAVMFWRNQRIIGQFEWVFTWDGLATRSADFNPLSTLIVQLHPAISEGLRRLHEQIVPRPEWLGSILLIVFVLLGAAACLAARRLWLAVTVAGTLFYFLVLDSGMSSNFFRIYVVLFPAFVYGVARLVALWPQHRNVALALAALFVLAGAPMFQPPPSVQHEAVIPPDGMLDDELYLVNSTVYHPESVIRRYPGKRFLGLPLHADQLEPFLAAHPDARRVLWHDTGVQGEILDALAMRPGSRVLLTGTNGFGRGYTVLELAP